MATTPMPTHAEVDRRGLRAWLGIAFARVAFPVLTLVSLLGSLTLAGPQADGAQGERSERP